MEKCEACGALASELRRGRCWECYSRYVEARPVGFGATCRVCGERRRAHLRSVELLGVWAPVCHDCAARAARLEPMPPSLAELRDALRRDRRQLVRRVPRPEAGRAAGDRRRAERRTAARAAGGTGAARLPHDPLCADESAPDVDDEMILEIAELATELESLAEDLGEVVELTRIHELGR